MHWSSLIFNCLRWLTFPSKSTTTVEVNLENRAVELWDNVLARAYFDITVLHDLAKSSPKYLKDAYAYHESIRELKRG